MTLKLTFALVLTTLLSVSAIGQEMLEITFNDVPGVECGEAWVQSGVSIMVTTTTSEDCDGGGNCTWIPWDGNSGVGMAPARLSLDLGQSYLIYSVEIDVEDYCGIGCTRAFLYNNGVQVGSTSNATRNEVETMVVTPVGDYADSIAISTCEGVVLGNTIRIYSEAVATEPSSWGVIKGTYR